MADDDPDEASPWECDDWVPESAIPDSDVFGRREPSRSPSTPQRSSARSVPMPQSWPSDAPELDPLVVESTSPGRKSERDGRRRPSRRTAVAVGAAVVAAAGLILSVVDWSSESESEQPAPTAPVSASTESSAPVVTTLPFGSTVIDVSDRVPSMPRDQDIDGWIDWSLPAADIRGAFGGLHAATEVVAITADGVLHRIELPGGRVRSRPVPDMGSNAQIALAADAVAVPQFRDVTIVADDGSLSSFGESTAEVPRVVRLGESDRFLVLGGRVAANDTEQLWLLDSNGSVADTVAAELTEVDAWNRQFLPSGELLVNSDGGVDAIDSDGTVRRVEGGEVVATGRNHYAVRQCDRRCEYTLVDVSSDDRRPAELPALDDYRFYDTSARVSPDGRFLHLADWRRGQPLALLISTTTGSVLNSWPLDTIRAPDAWAADSLGYFAVTNGSLTFSPVDGGVTVIEGLGAVRSVATRPLG